MPAQFSVSIACATLMEMVPWTEGYRTIWDADWSMTLVTAILLTCLFAIAVNIVTYALIGRTSAVTYQVVGHLKTVLTLIAGYYLFTKASAHGSGGSAGEAADEEEGTPFVHLFGILVAMVGMVLYGDIKSVAAGQQSMLSRWFPAVDWAREF